MQVDLDPCALMPPIVHSINLLTIIALYPRLKGGIYN